MKLSRIIDPDMVHQQASCGECTACCTLLPIPELDKPRSTDCRHLIKDGGCTNCSIYESRPEPCQGFECLWRMGFLKAPATDPESYRPDQLGLMWWFTSDGQDQPQCLVAYETRAGARDEPKARYLINNLIAHIPVFINTFEGKTLCWGPKAKVLALRDELIRCGAIGRDDFTNLGPIGPSNM